MVHITEETCGLLDKITRENSPSLNTQILNSYEKMNKQMIQYQYNIARERTRQRYHVAKQVISTINIIDIRRDNYVRFLSLLLLVTGGALSFVCYKNTDAVHDKLNGVYISVDGYYKNSTGYYEQMSLDESGYFIGYVSMGINIFLKMALSVVDFIKFISLTILGIFVGVTEIGSVAVSSSIFFITVVFTMIMIKFMSSSISVGLTGTHIRDVAHTIHVGELGDILCDYFKGV